MASDLSANAFDLLINAYDLAIVDADLTFTGTLSPFASCLNTFYIVPLIFSSFLFLQSKRMRMNYSRLFSSLPAPVPLYFERFWLKLYCSDMPISLEYW